MPVPLQGTNIYRALLQALKGGSMLYGFTFKSNNSVIWALRLSLELHRDSEELRPMAGKWQRGDWLRSSGGEKWPSEEILIQGPKEITGGTEKVYGCLPDGGGEKEK